MTTECYIEIKGTNFYINWNHKFIPLICEVLNEALESKRAIKNSRVEKVLIAMGL